MGASRKCIYSSLFAPAVSPSLLLLLCSSADTPAPIANGASGLWAHRIADARSVTRLRPQDAKVEHASTCIFVFHSASHLFPLLFLSLRLSLSFFFSFFSNRFLAEKSIFGFPQLIFHISDFSVSRSRLFSELVITN